MPCIVIQWLVMLSYKTQCHDMICNATACNAMTCNAMPCHAMTRYAMTRNDMQCSDMTCNTRATINAAITVISADTPARSLQNCRECFTMFWSYNRQSLHQQPHNRWLPHWHLYIYRTDLVLNFVLIGVSITTLFQEDNFQMGC